MRQQNTRMETFLSLEWYDVALRFLFTFVAKTSEILLAVGLVVSTANFLTDGSIVATYPTVSIAWAWTQALAIDSSLGVSFSYAFQCFKQKAWVKAGLYALLTSLLALVAGAITTVDIFSHALHLTMSDATIQMGFNVMVLSRLRAIAVIGFILMSRLRDLPLTPPAMETRPSLLPTSGQMQESRVQEAIQFLCSQFSSQQLVEILNACIVSKKVMLAWVPLNKKLEVPASQQRQSHRAENVAEPRGTGEPEPHDGLRIQSSKGPISSTEPPKNALVAMEPFLRVEPHIQPVSEPQPQLCQVPEPQIEAPPEEQMVELALSREPLDGADGKLEPQATLLHERLEQAYQSLVVGGKKPSGRALAQRVHVHRSTCVEWLRTRRQQPSVAESMQEQPGCDDAFEPMKLLDRVFTKESTGSAPERNDTSVPVVPSDILVGELSASGTGLHESAEDTFPDVSPDS